MPLNEQGLNAGPTGAALLQRNRLRSQKYSVRFQGCELHHWCLRLLHFRERAPGPGNYCHSRALPRWLHLLNEIAVWGRYHDFGKWPHAPSLSKPLHLQMESLQTFQPQCREARHQEKELHNWLIWSPGQVHHRQRCQRRKSPERVRQAESKLWQDASRQI